MESTIVLLLFLILLIGVMDISQVLFFHHFLQQRAWAGARYATVHTYDAAAIKNVVAYNSSTAGNAGLFGLTPAMVSVNLYEAGTPNARIEVDITTFHVRFISPWLLQDWTPVFRAVLPVESAGAAT